MTIAVVFLHVSLLRVDSQMDMVEDLSRQSITTSLLALIINKLYRRGGKETGRQNKYSKIVLYHKIQIKTMDVGKQYKI